MSSIEFQGSGLEESVAYSTSATLHGSSTFAFGFWFKTPSTSGLSAGWAYMYNDGELFPSELSVFIDTAGDVTFYHRGDDSGTSSTYKQTGTYDDNAWHSIIFHRVSATNYDFYIDEAYVGGASNNVGAGTAAFVDVGATESAILARVLPDGGLISGLWTTTDSITFEQARAALYGKINFTTKLRALINPDGSTDPDYSLNGYDGTINANVSVVAESPPILNAFGFSAAEYKYQTVVPAGLSIPVAVYHYNHNIGSN